MRKPAHIRCGQSQAVDYKPAFIKVVWGTAPVWYKSITAISVLLFLMWLQTGCSKKFAEDDGITFKSPLERIYGPWVISGYAVEGTDELVSLKNALGSCFGHLVFYYEGQNGVRIYSDSCMIYGSMRFKQNKTLLLEFRYEFSQPDSMYPFPFLRQDLLLLQPEVLWKIRRLDDSGLVLRSTEGPEQILTAYKL